MKQVGRCYDYSAGDKSHNTMQDSVDRPQNKVIASNHPVRPLKLCTKDSSLGLLHTLNDLQQEVHYETPELDPNVDNDGSKLSKQGVLLRWISVCCTKQDLIVL